MKINKNIKKCVLAITLIATLLFSSLSVFAAGGTVNGQDVTGGDIITYSLSLEDVPENKISGLSVRVNYDSENLEIMEDTLNFPTFSNPIYNLDLEDHLLFNIADAINGYNINEDGMIFSVSFTVKDGFTGNTNVTGEILEIYNMDIVEITSHVKVDTITHGTLAGVVAPSTLEEIEASAKDEAAKSEGFPTVIIIAGVGLLVVGGFIVIIFMKKKKDSDTNESAE